MNTHTYTHVNDLPDEGHLLHFTVQLCVCGTVPPVGNGSRSEEPSAPTLQLTAQIPSIIPSSYTLSLFLPSPPPPLLPPPPLPPAAQNVFISEWLQKKPRLESQWRWRRESVKLRYGTPFYPTWKRHCLLRLVRKRDSERLGEEEEGRRGSLGR